ncbi:MAG TPA: S-layer homology domain-containing protein [Bryobacteraceae bacterium]|jgi:hypothetical protein|nr:S-layer homology domain-containing protein [Bryobacteraceae bacterium]
MIRLWLFVALSMCAYGDELCSQLAMVPSYADFLAGASGAGWHRVSMSNLCKWSASTDQTWIRLGNTWGWGKEPLWYGVSENTGAARTGSIRVVSESGAESIISVRQREVNPKPDRVVAVPQIVTMDERTVNQVVQVHRSGFYQGFQPSLDALLVFEGGLSIPYGAPHGIVVAQTKTVGNRVQSLSIVADVATNSPLTVPIIRRENACPVAVTANIRSFGFTGGAGTLNVTADPSCVWTIRKSADWLTLSVIGTTQGSRLIPFQVTANWTTLPRFGYVDIGGTVIHFEVAGAYQQAMFRDVPRDHPFANHILAMKTRGITKGCKDGSEYCPDQPITRGELSVFLVRCLFGSSDDFWYEAKPLFTDVPADHSFFKHIQKLGDILSLGYCPGGSKTACPNAIVTRGEMANAIVALKFGLNSPVLAGNEFVDTKAGLGFISPASKMREQGITLGCSTTHFCPSDNVTRGQMAVFLVRAFLTQ